MQVYNWCAGDEHVYLVVEEAVGSELPEHLGCSLRVSDVSQLGLSRSIKSILDLGCCIVLAVFIEAVVKEFLLIENVFWVQSIVASSVKASSIAAHPDFVSLIGQNVCQ